MKVIILTQYYPPEHGAPQNRLHDLAKRMKNTGHDVTVLTAMPNYPKGEIFTDYRGKLIVEENIDGIEVIRTWILPAKKKSFVRQLIAYFSFVKSSAFFGLLKLKKADFLICESPPLFLGATALVLSFAKSAKLMMNISDLWPESAVQLGMLKPGIILSSLEWFEKLLYQKSTLVLCQTEGIVEGVKKRSPSSETFLLPNGVDLDTFKKHPRDANFAKEIGLPEDSFIVGYAGNHGRSQALTQLIKAAMIIQKKEDLILSKKIFFALFGDGPEKDELMKKSVEMKLENLKFFPSVPAEKMPKLLSQFDLALVPLKNIELFEGARPSKIFELMGVQIPFIFCGRGEGAKIAEESGGAVIVPPETPEKLADAIVDFVKLPEETRIEMGRKARKFAENNFNRAKFAENFIKQLEKRRNR
ncbi:MAG TPA: glycosyltransferase family 4 protein [Victivallales bacterium]|nr:glycosyltransferase family 4 protein [Victivallales bacterium]